jgi:hypothetical protein
MCAYASIKVMRANKFVKMPFDCGMNLTSKRVAWPGFLPSCLAKGIDGAIAISNNLDQARHYLDDHVLSVPDKFTVHYTAGQHPHHARKLTGEK